MRARRSTALLALLFLGILFPSSASTGESRIASISVVFERPPPQPKSPNHHMPPTAITEEQVIKVLPVHEGDAYTPEKVDQAVSYLKKWGRFKDINVDRQSQKDGMHLTFRLKDGDMVSGIDIYGTYPYLSARIRRSVTVHSGDLYNEGLAQDQTGKIQSFYERHGYGQTSVDFKSKTHDNKHTVDLKYKVDKGKLYRIGKISVNGNTLFPQSYFVSQINPLLAYTPSRMRKSLDRIRKHYQESGYLGARVRLGDLGKEDAARRVNPTLEIMQGKHVTVVFEGNHRLSLRTFKKTIPMFTDGGYGSYEIEASEKAISDAYRKLGYQEIIVSSSQEEEKNHDKGLTVRFKIHEGPQTRVKTVEINGNQEISDHKIKKQLYTKENTLFERGYYQPRTVIQDFERLPGLMKEQGALDAQAIDHDTTLNTFHDKAHVTFKVDEGTVVKVTTLTFEGNKHFPDNKLRGRLPLSQGDNVSQTKIDEGKENLAVFYANNGFPYATVQADLQRDGATSTLTYKIDEGSEVHIGQVLVVGNERTDPKAIYRAMRIRSGYIFSYKKILDSEADLRRSGAFRSANIQTIGLTEKEDIVHLVVKVEEYRKIVLDFGATYDTDNFFTGDLTITHLNLLGTIRRANLKLTGGRDIQKGELLFKDPFFLGFPFEAALDLSLERDLKPGFKVVEGGGSLSFLRQFTPRISFLGRYSIIRTFFSDVVDATGIPEADHTTSKFSFSFNYDKRNSYADPRSGFIGFAGIDISNKLLASTFNFIQPKGYIAYYLPLGSRLTLISFGRVEGIKVFGSDDLARDQKLFLGGDYSVRGFSEDAIGPIGSDGRPAGGQLLMMASMELQMRLFDNFKLAGFSDMGTLTDNFSQLSWFNLRHSAGAGLRYVTPVGQLRLDYAFKLDRRPDEAIGRLHIAFGYAF